MTAPGTRTTESLFAGRPASLLLFKVVRRFIGSLGPVEVEAAKTQVSFKNARKFAWVWLPLRSTTTRPDNCIVLTFALDRRVIHDRIAESVEPYPGRFTHHVIIERESDLNDDVRGWLSEAYAFGQTRRARRRKS